MENKVDVYQLGNLLLFLLTGEPLEGAEAVDEGRLEALLEGLDDEELKGLLRAMLAFEPWRRPSSDEVVKALAALYHSRVGRGG